MRGFGTLQWIALIIALIAIGLTALFIHTENVTLAILFFIIALLAAFVCFFLDFLEDTIELVILLVKGLFSLGKYVNKKVTGNNNKDVLAVASDNPYKTSVPLQTTQTNIPTLMEKPINQTSTPIQYPADNNHSHDQQPIDLPDSEQTVTESNVGDEKTYCNGCGESISDTERLCTSCGIPIRESNKQVALEKTAEEETTAEEVIVVKQESVINYTARKADVPEQATVTEVVAESTDTIEKEKASEMKRDESSTPTPVTRVKVKVKRKVNK